MNEKKQKKLRQIPKRLKNGAQTDALKPSINDTRVVLHFEMYLGFSSGSSQTTRKTMLSSRHQKTAPKTPILWRKKQKNLRRLIFKYPVSFFGRKARPRNHCFRSVFLTVPKRGFNYSPLNCRHGGSIKHP